MINKKHLCRCGEPLTKYSHGGYPKNCRKCFLNKDYNHGGRPKIPPELRKKRVRTRKFVLPKNIKENNPKYGFDITKIAKKSGADFRPLLKPVYCDYELCKCIITLLKKGDIKENAHSVIVNGVRKNYCQEWCYQMDNLLKIEHTCKTCGVALAPFNRFKEYKDKVYTNNSSVYPKYCKLHMKQGRRNLTEQPIDLLLDL